MEKIFIHPDYNPDQAYYDIAIIKISRIEYSATIKPICIPVTPGINVIKLFMSLIYENL